MNQDTTRQNPKPKWSKRKRAAGWASGIVALLILILVSGIFALDSAAGHRWLLRKVEANVDGLEIKALRGSIYSAFQLEGVSLSDSEGQYLTVPQVKITWSPWSLWRKHVNIKRLQADELLFLRPPKAEKDAQEKGFQIPQLPVDITVKSLNINEIHVVNQNGGRPFSLESQFSVRRDDVSALYLALTPLAENGGEHAFIDVSFAPKRRILKLDIDVNAPAGGIIAGLSGIDEGFTINANGSGPFEDWRAQAILEIADGDSLTIEAHHQGEGWSATYLLNFADLDSIGGAIDGTLSITPDDNGIAIEVAAENKSGQMRFKGPILTSPDYRFGPNARLQLHITDNDAIPLRDIELEAMLQGPLLQPVADVSARFLPRENASPALTALIKDGGTMRTRLAYANDRINLSALSLSAADFQASGSLVYALNNGALEGALAFTLDRNERWADITGGIEGDVELGRDTAQGALAVTMELNGVQLQSQQAQIQALLSEHQHMTAQASLDDEAFVLSALTLETAALTAQVSGRLEGERLETTANINIQNAGTIDPVLHGPAQINITANGALDNPTLKARAEVAEITLAGTQLQTVKLSADGMVKSGLNLEFSASVDDQALTGKAIFSVDNGWRADDINFTYVGWQASGTLSQSASDPLVGTINLLKEEDASPLFGLDGRLWLKAGLSAQNDTQVIDFEIDGKLLRFTFNENLIRSDEIVAAGRLRLNEQGPSLRMSATGSSLESEGLFIPSLRIEAVREGHVTKADVTFTTLLPVEAGFNIGAVITPEEGGAWSLLAELDGEIDGTPIASTKPIALAFSSTRQDIGPAMLSIGNGTMAGAFKLVDGTVTANADLDSLPLKLLRTLGLAVQDAGTFSGDIALRNTPEEKSAMARLKLQGLMPTGIKDAQPIDAQGSLVINGQDVELTAQADSADGPTLHLTLNTKAGWRTFPNIARDSGVRGRLNLNSPLAPLWALTDQSDHIVEGRLQGGIDISGTLEHPLLNGEIALLEGGYENRDVGLILTPITAELRLDGRSITLQSLEAQDGNGGTLRGEGQVLIDFAERLPGQITLKMQEFWAVRRDDLRAKTNGEVRIVSQNGALRITGKLDLARAEITLKDSDTASIPSINYVEINAPAGGFQSVEQEQPPLPVTLDVDVRAERRLFVNGLGLSSEWSANLKISGPATEPAITGEARLIRGELDFAGKRFDLQRGVLSFLGGKKVDPRLDIVAENVQADLTARIAVTGVASNPRLSLSSSPTLPEDEILSRILFGTSVADLSALEAVQLASAVTSLSGGGGGLNVLGAARRGLGIDRLSVGTATSDTAITGGKYLTDDVYLEVTSDPASGQTAASVEWSITRRLSIISRLGADRDTNMAVRWSRDY